MKEPESLITVTKPGNFSELFCYKNIRDKILIRVKDIQDADINEYPEWEEEEYNDAGIELNVEQAELLIHHLKALIISMQQPT